MGRDVFQQRERWLEEPREYVNRDEPIIGGAGYMSLPAITDEVTEAAADPRRHTNQQGYDWQSRARGLDDALAWLGPQLRAHVAPTAAELSSAIAADLRTLPSLPSACSGGRI